MLIDLPQGYMVYPPNPPVPQIPFGQQQVVFGSMPAQVPAAVTYVPVVPVPRTYATSYAAASSRALQPTAAPFVSSPEYLAADEVPLAVQALLYTQKKSAIRVPDVCEHVVCISLHVPLPNDN